MIFVCEKFQNSAALGFFPLLNSEYLQISQLVVTGKVYSEIAYSTIQYAYFILV